MAYNATEFTFDGIPSEHYGLHLMEIGGKAGQGSFDGAKLELYTDSVYRRATQYLLGVSYKEPLKFKISFASYEPIDRFKLSQIQKWLFGHAEYKKLQIMQEDLQYVYFNCVLNNPSITTIDNNIYGLTCDVVCDAPWAWEFERTYSYNITLNPQNIVFQNKSDNNDYTYPTIKVTCNKANGTISIINKTDENREFKLTGLSVGEEITVNNELQIITSSLGLNRLSNFNKKFFRLLPNVNALEVKGDVSKVEIKYKNAKKVGS